MTPENEKDLGFILKIVKWGTIGYFSPFIAIGMIFAGIFLLAIIHNIVIKLGYVFHLLVNINP
jgi:hypothetical protein